VDGDCTKTEVLYPVQINLNLLLYTFKLRLMCSDYGSIARVTLN